MIPNAGEIFDGDESHTIGVMTADIALRLRTSQGFDKSDAMTSQMMNRAIVDIPTVSLRSKSARD